VRKFETVVIPTEADDCGFDMMGDALKRNKRQRTRDHLKFMCKPDGPTPEGDPGDEMLHDIAEGCGGAELAEMVIVTHKDDQAYKQEVEELEDAGEWAMNQISSSSSESTRVSCVQRNPYGILLFAGAKTLGITREVC
jgi:hypothetical protein